MNHYHHSHYAIPKEDVTPEGIIKRVCLHFDIDREQLNKKTRKAIIVVPRQVAMYFVKKKTKLSLKEIGSLFGGYDHTSVIHSCLAVQNRLDTDKFYRYKVSSIYNVEFQEIKKQAA